MPGDRLQRPRGSGLVRGGMIGLTGGSGFVGGHVLAALRERGWPVRLLLRPDVPVPGGWASDPQVSVVRGDLLTGVGVESFVEGLDGLVHLVGIIREHRSLGVTFERVHVEAVRNLLDAAEMAGVTRWVQISALGARATAPSRYHRTKAQAEALVAASDLAWTIFRPSLIYGPGGEFTEMVRDFWCRRWPPVVPYFGAGVLGLGRKRLVQPVFVDDVAACVVRSLECEAASNRLYELGGPERMTWPEMYRVFRREASWKLQSRTKPVFPIPAWWARCLAALPLPLPFNRDQVLMSQEDSICDPSQAERDCDWRCRRMAEALGGD